MCHFLQVWFLCIPALSYTAVECAKEPSPERHLADLPTAAKVALFQMLLGLLQIYIVFVFNSYFEKGESESGT